MVKKKVKPERPPGVYGVRDSRIKSLDRGASGGSVAKHLTLDLGSGHDLLVS